MNYVRSIISFVGELSIKNIYMDNSVVIPRGGGYKGTKW